MRIKNISIALLCLLFITESSLGQTKSAPSRLPDRQVDIALPDVVLLEPTGSEVITDRQNFRIRALVRSRIPLVAVRVTINGETKKIPIEGSIEERHRYLLDVEIPLQGEKTIVGIIAENDKASSKPITTTILYQQKPRSSKPNLAVLAIGVARSSRGSGLNQKTATANAEAFAKLMNTQLEVSGIFADVQARVLVNDAANRESIVESLKWLQTNNRSANDISILFLSGNLEAQHVDSSLYFLTSKHDSKTDLEITDIRYDLFWELLDSVKGTALIFSDTNWVDSGGKFLLERFVQFGKKGRVNSYFSSADGSFVGDDKSPYTLFTKAIMEGLEGKADLQMGGESDGIIDTHELQTWIRWRVENLTDAKQVPVIQVHPKRVAIFKIAAPR